MIQFWMFSNENSVLPVDLMSFTSLDQS